MSFYEDLRKQKQPIKKAKEAMPELDTEKREPITEEEYWEWVKQFKAKCKKECEDCLKAEKNGTVVGMYGVLCEHCLSDWQLQVNLIKRKVEVKNGN